MNFSGYYLPKIIGSCRGWSNISINSCKNLSTKMAFGCYSMVKKPGFVSPRRPVPISIATPQYWPHGVPEIVSEKIEIKTHESILGVDTACRLARKVLTAIEKYVKVGVTTDELDRICHEAALSLNCFPSPLSYRGFPKSVCTSVNNVAVHGIPDDRRLLPDDIISIDVSVYHNGYHGDCCETFILPETDEAGRHLVEVAMRCRDEAIAACSPGVPFMKIGEVCEHVACAEGLKTVPIITGHGIGTYFHGPPDIFHCANNEEGVMLPGMCFTIEPVVVQGDDEMVVLEDGWSVLTLDGGRAAQFEHTILVTDHGHKILTDYIT